MDNTKGWILTIGILAILALTAFGLVRIVQDSVENTIAPVQNMTGSLGTRVAEILNPTPTIMPDPVTIIHKVRSLARLETIQYSIEKVIRAENSSGAWQLLFGDKLLFVAHGNVIAGIDLEKLKPEDLKLEQGVLSVKLPAPEIFMASLDNAKSYIYDRETGLFSKGDINLETTVRQIAEDEIRKAAMEDGVLAQAGENGKVYLERLFEQLGFRQVIFLEETSTPEP